MVYFNKKDITHLKNNTMIITTVEMGLDETDIFQTKDKGAILVRNLSIHLSIYPSIHLSIYPSIHLSIHLSI